MAFSIIFYDNFQADWLRGSRFIGNSEGKLRLYQTVYQMVYMSNIMSHVDFFTFDTICNLPYFLARI